jgi:hypothetical protein
MQLNGLGDSVSIGAAGRSVERPVSLGCLGQHAGKKLFFSFESLSKLCAICGLHTFNSAHGGAFKEAILRGHPNYPMPLGIKMREEDQTFPIEIANKRNVPLPSRAGESDLSSEHFFLKAQRFRYGTAK